MLYPRTFYYKITDPNCTKSIKVDVDKYKTISDLKKQIALDLHISEADFQINNPYNDESLIEIPSSSELTVNIFHRCYHIEFIFPDYSRIQIPNSYRMTIEEVLDYFAQKQLIFPSTSKKLLQFTFSNHVLPNIKYPFLAIPVLTPVHIVLPHKAVFITYGTKKFIFTENDSVGQCTSEIKSFYPSSSLVLLRDGLDQKIDFWLKLNSNEKYNLFIGFQVPFKNTDDTLFFTKKIDSLATVDDARIVVADELSKSGTFVRPEEIVLCDFFRKPISGVRRSLASVQSLFTTFFFFIDKEEAQPVLKKSIFRFAQSPSKQSQNCKELRRINSMKSESSTLFSTSFSVSLSTESDSYDTTSIVDSHSNHYNRKIDKIYGRPNKLRKVKNNDHSASKKSSEKVEKAVELDDVSSDLTSSLSDCGSSSSLRMFLMFDKTDEYNNEEISESVGADLNNEENEIGRHVSSAASDSASNQMVELVEGKKEGEKVQSKTVDDKEHKKQPKSRQKRSKNKNKSASNKVKK